jgi:hypothetical protein
MIMPKTKLTSKQIKEDRIFEQEKKEYAELEVKIRAHDAEIREKYKEDYKRYSELINKFTLVD